MSLLSYNILHSIYAFIIVPQGHHHHASSSHKRPLLMDTYGMIHIIH